MLLVVGMASTSVMPIAAVAGDSMEPTLSQGDLMLFKGVKPSQIELGDIIVFNVPIRYQQKYGYPGLIAHRVVDIDSSRNPTTFRTQGDNSGAQDPFRIPSSSIRGELSTHVPVIGYFLLFLKSPHGLAFLAISMVMYLLYLSGAELKRAWRALIGNPPQAADTTQLAQKMQALSEEVRQSRHVQEARLQKMEDVTGGVQQALQKFAFAMGEYGEHLRSHTAAVKGLADTSQRLGEVVEKLDERLSYGSIGPLPQAARERLIRRLDQAIARLSGAVPPESGSSQREKETA